MKTLYSMNVYTAAMKAAMLAVLRSGEVDAIRVAVYDDQGRQGFALCSRAFYEEGCSESEWIGQAWSYVDDHGKLKAAWES